MSTLGGKYGKISDDEEKKGIEKQRLKDLEIEKAKGILDHKKAQEIIAKIPQIIEKVLENERIPAARREAHIEVVGDDKGTSGFWSSEIVPAFATNKFIFDYCNKQGLKPKFKPSHFHKDTGYSPASIEIHW